MALTSPGRNECDPFDRAHVCSPGCDGATIPTDPVVRRRIVSDRIAATFARELQTPQVVLHRADGSIVIEQTQTVLLSRPVLRRHVAGPVLRVGYKMLGFAAGLLIALLAFGMAVRDIARLHSDDDPPAERAAHVLETPTYLAAHGSDGSDASLAINGAVVDRREHEVRDLRISGWVDALSGMCGDLVAGVTVLDVAESCTIMHVQPSSAGTMGGGFGEGRPPQVDIVGIVLRNSAGARVKPLDGRVIELIADDEVTIYDRNANAAGDERIFWPDAYVAGPMVALSHTAMILVYDGHEDGWKLLVAQPLMSSVH